MPLFHTNALTAVDDDLIHLTTMPMEKSPGRGHKQGGGDDQERQGGGHQRHQAGN